MLSPELIEQRRGNITASAAHRMMAGWNAPTPSSDFPHQIYNWIDHAKRKPLVGDIKNEVDCDVSGKLIDAAWKYWQHENTTPQGLLTYAEELACDELFDHDPATEVNTKAMEIGNERELDAIAEFMEATGLELTKLGDDQIHLADNGIGCTPDGIAYDELDLIKTGCEVKCRTPLHHARQLLINDNASLIEHDFERFCQIQVACLVAGVDYWYSVNFNPYAKDTAHRLHYCKITRDDTFIAILKQRAEMVFTHKQQFLNKLLAVSNPEQEAA